MIYLLSTTVVVLTEPLSPAFYEPVSLIVFQIYLVPKFLGIPH